MAAETFLITARQAEEICPACLGTGSRADELRAPAVSGERLALADQPCATCDGAGTLGGGRMPRFARRGA